MYSKINKNSYNKIMDLFDNPALFTYSLPDFKVVDGIIYINLDTIPEDVKSLFIHKNIYIESFFYNPYEKNIWTYLY